MRTCFYKLDSNEKGAKEQNLVADLKSEALCFASEQDELVQTQFKKYTGKRLAGECRGILQGKRGHGARDTCSATWI